MAFAVLILIPLFTHAIETDLSPGGSEDYGTSLLLAQNTDTNDKNTPPPGTLLIPGALPQVNDNEEKKCMTVCAVWGEDCTYINRGTAGTTRSCRRTCQQFTEECF